ncbi:haloacid dehalogenase-like hydrolase domain-containing protein 2 [Oppia nitens]|uniref:haloacid dehalogenase-like hydrolase domain-containing protein 2 n=1 Tax=Oppia nitens TaxID=1686743 RepID=UPI0023DB6C72|nr:haloacid dehalogenase-like hydrolase domain-containing protein 2 [Oppia nitens]
MLSKVKTVLIDLSGTLHVESTETPGAIDALNRLRSSGLKLRFVTNTTKESQNYLYNRLKSIGFDIRKEEIFTSLLAAKELVKKLKLKPYLMLADEAKEDFEDIPCVQTEHEDGNGVVIGLAPNRFNYESMNTAFHMLLNRSQLIAINKSRYYKTNSGLCLAAGPFVAALEFATDTKAMVVGKPNDQFFMQALEPFDCRPDEAVMIGDDVRDDIDGAQRLGMTGILVQTGKYRASDETMINPPPNYLLPTFSDAIDLLLK